MDELDQRQKDLEEEEFLRELRALAGMEEAQQPQQADEARPQQVDPAPRQLQSAPVIRPAEPSPQAAPAERQPKPERQGSGQTRRVDLRGAEPIRERPRPQQSEVGALPQLPKGVPGWIPGLLILLAALAVLALTGLGVWRGLHM